MIALVHGADEFGAVEHYVAALFTGLRERGVPALLLHADTSAVARFGDLAGGSVRVETYSLELLRGPAVRAVAKLTSRLRGLRADVVHVADVWPAAQIAGRLSGARVLVTHHTPALQRQFSLAGRAWWRAGWLVRPDVVYTSDTDRRDDGRSGLRTHVVPLGVDIGRFTVSRVSHDGVVIGNVARLVPQKGQRYLVEALARLPDARLVIVGDGELRDELQRLAVDLGVADRLELLGARDDVPALLAGFDAFAFPSLFEGLGLAVIEAQLAGVPVVATPVGGVQETVVDGVTGLHVAPRDPEALAAAIRRLIGNRAEAERLVAEARRRATRFSIERMIEATLALYGGASPPTTEPSPPTPARAR